MIVYNRRCICFTLNSDSDEEVAMNTEDELMEAELVEFARALDIDTKKPEKKYVFL